MAFTKNVLLDPADVPNASGKGTFPQWPEEKRGKDAFFFFIFKIRFLELHKHDMVDDIVNNGFPDRKGASVFGSRSISQTRQARVTRVYTQMVSKDLAQENLQRIQGAGSRVPSPNPKISSITNSVHDIRVLFDVSNCQSWSCPFPGSDPSQKDLA